MGYAPFNMFDETFVSFHRQNPNFSSDITHSFKDTVLFSIKMGTLSCINDP